MRARTMIVTVVVLLCAALPVSADLIVTIKCTAGNQSTIQEFLAQGENGIYSWSLAEPLDIMAGDMCLGKITQLDVQSDSDPYVNLKFAVEAGQADTTFDISSAVVSFAPMLNPKAYASAGVTLTSDSDGATITGLFDGGMNYQARYNSTAVYANLVEGFSIDADDTVTQKDRSPASGYRTISGSVSSIESEFKFTLSALDQASGTSRFEVIPEPATMCLLAIGGLVMIRRRKK